MLTFASFENLLDVSALLFGAFGLALIAIAWDVDRMPKRLCAAIFASTIASSILQLLRFSALGTGAAYGQIQGLALARMLATPLPSLLVFAYFLWRTGDDLRTSALLRIECALCALMAVSGCLALLDGQMSVMPEDTPRMGIWATLCFASIIALTALSLVMLSRRWGRVTVLQRILFMGCFLAPATIQIILVEVLVSYDLIQAYVDQRERNRAAQSRIAVLQMRPHFIHNTLTSIYYLCTKDPQAAQQVIRDFSSYLQANFTAIAAEEAIPFTKELEHTRAYLAVEQASHAGMLQVDFDTPVDCFRLPPLTLQPIVENAVKHGLDPDGEPLRISVSTRETPEGILVAVEDTGSGYAPEEDVPSFALDNIRGRLREKCGGTLAIGPRDGGGTRATILIPRKG